MLRLRNSDLLSLLHDYIFEVYFINIVLLHTKNISADIYNNLFFKLLLHCLLVTSKGVMTVFNKDSLLNRNFRQTPLSYLWFRLVCKPGFAQLQRRNYLHQFIIIPVLFPLSIVLHAAFSN